MSRWHTGDLPPEGQVSVPVRAISSETLMAAELLSAAITEAILTRRSWDHLVLEAIVEAERRGEAYAVASEAPTLIPAEAPDPRTLALPGADTGYSTVGAEEHPLDGEIIFDLAVEHPDNP